MGLRSNLTPYGCFDGHCVVASRHLSPSAAGLLGHAILPASRQVIAKGTGTTKMMDTSCLTNQRAITVIKEQIKDNIRVNCFEREVIERTYFKRMNLVLQK